MCGYVAATSSLDKCGVPNYTIAVVSQCEANFAFAMRELLRALIQFLHEPGKVRRLKPRLLLPFIYETLNFRPAIIQQFVDREMGLLK